MKLEEILDKHGKVGTAAETAYAVLREAIVTGALAAGTPLRANDIAQRLGVSKTPVREALRKLEAEELIALQPRNGLVVAALSEQQLVEIYYIREALEGRAARLAAEHITQVELANLRNLLSEMEAACQREDLKTLRALTGEFQLSVFRASRNERLYRLIKQLQEHMRQYPASTLSLPGRPLEAVAYCRNLVDSITRRDADGAERIARENRRRTLELRVRMSRSRSAVG
jgi:DNA-binding GntR family transcriptional regulator